MYIDCTNQKVVGYSLKAYILEKGLIVNEKVEDRKFHVFYAIMKYMPIEQKQKYRFKSDFSGYKYLAHSLSSVSTNGDQQTYDNIMSNFDDFGYSQAEQDSIFYNLSVVLLLGNLKFIDQADKSKLFILQLDAVPKFEDNEDLTAICDLLQCTKADLELEFGRKLIGKASEDNYKSINTADCLIRRYLLLIKGCLGQVSV